MPDDKVPDNDNFLIGTGQDVDLPTAPAAPPTGDDRRNLVNLLGQVRRIWITNVLEHSVRDAALLDRQAQMEPGAVEPSWRRYLEAAGQPPGLVPPDRPIGRVFDDAGRMLLILGAPGAGKTTTLLMLARECIERAERDAAAPVPVVLSLSSWTGSRPFHDWLVRELGKAYGVGRSFARRWLQEHRLLVMLDGLDEVVEDRRGACVQALNAFIQKHGVPGLVVCCRSIEYGALPVRLRLGGAVLLLPLEQAQVEACLDAAGPALDGLRGALARNAELRRLSESPLMLSIMAVAFRDLSAGALKFDERSDPKELREAIVGRFVDRMFALRGRQDEGFSRERMERGLRWLASGMMERGSIFAVELLQPEWLTPRQLLLYLLGSRAAAAIMATAAIGAVVCLSGLVLFGGQALAPDGVGATMLVMLAATVAMGLLTGLFYARLGYYTVHRAGETQREVRIVEDLGLFIGYLALSCTAALLVGELGVMLGFSIRHPPTLAAFVTISVSALCLPLLLGTKAGRGAGDRDIGLAGTLSWEWRTAVDLTIVGTVASGIMIAVSPRLGVPRPGAALLAAITIFTLVTYGSWRQEVPPVDRWRNGKGRFALRNSGRVFGYAGLACVLALFPLLALGLNLSLPDAFSVAVLAAIVLFSPALFWFGGIDLVLHAALRLTLALTRTMPLRLRRFLNYAVHLGFLQRAGGGYIFFHRMLLEHFAAHATPDAAVTHPDLSAPVPHSNPSAHPVAIAPGIGDSAGSPHDAAAEVRILFLAANSILKPLDLEFELRCIEDHLLRARMRERLTLKAVPAVTVSLLMQTMMEEAPTHVHFSGHGTRDGIVLRDELGDPFVVSREALASLFKLCGDSVRCVVLNACFTHPQAQSIREHVPHVVGSTDRIQDAAALSFSSGFYLAIAAGKEVPYAFEAGKVRMRMDNVPGEEHLVLL